MSDIDDKIETHAGYGVRARSRLDDITSEVENKLRFFSDTRSDNNIVSAEKLMRSIFGVDVRTNNEIKHLSDKQIAEMSLRAEGCLNTLTTLEKEGYIDVKKRAFLANILAKVFSR